MNTDNQPTLSQGFTQNQLRKRLGVSPSTLANWRKAGIGPAWTQVGRCYRYTAEDVQAWLTANSHVGGPLKESK